MNENLYAEETPMGARTGLLLNHTNMQIYLHEHTFREFVILRLLHIASFALYRQTANTVITSPGRM